MRISHIERSMYLARTRRYWACRLEAAHSAELNLAILEHRRANAEKYGDVIGPDIQTALAYGTKGAYLETLDKHMERQERLFHRSYRTLARHRKNQPLPTIEELQDLEQDIPSNAAGCE